MVNIKINASTCFEHYVFIIRRSKLYYTASGIITLCRWPSVVGQLLRSYQEIIARLLTTSRKNCMFFFYVFRSMHCNIITHYRPTKCILHVLLHHIAVLDLYDLFFIFLHCYICFDFWAVANFIFPDGVIGIFH